MRRIVERAPCESTSRPRREKRGKRQHTQTSGSRSEGSEILNSCTAFSSSLTSQAEVAGSGDQQLCSWDRGTRFATDV